MPPPDDPCNPPGTRPGEDNPGIPAGLTLENIIDLTGEFEHLNELVLLQLKNDGGFTGPESYFNVVHPILDLLEVEIRIRFHAGIGKQEMKLLIQDWIDEEIAVLKSGKKR
jgi:hypothetical protein